MSTTTALLLIDFQNDYLPNGAFGLYNTKSVLDNTLNLIKYAQSQQYEIVHIQHIADPKVGLAPFFNQGTYGVEIIQEIIQAAPDSPIIVKHFADSFEQTPLQDLLTQKQVKKLIICGMMTQNCVTHTALSKSAERYEIEIITDACTTVSEILHQIALHALMPRIKLSDLQSFIQ